MQFTVSGVVEESSGRLLVGPVYLGQPARAVAQATVPGWLPYEHVFEAGTADAAVVAALATATDPAADPAVHSAARSLSGPVVGTSADWAAADGSRS